MRVFNKVFTLLVLVLLLVLIPLFLFLPETTIATISNGLSGFEEFISANLAAQPTATYAVGALIELVILALFLLSIRTKPNQQQGRVRLVDGGTVEVAFRPLAVRLDKIVSDIRGVQNVSANVSIARRRLKVIYDVTLRPNANGNQVKSTIERATIETVEDKLGIRLVGKPEVNFEQREPEPPPKRSVLATEPEGEPEPERKKGGIFGFGRKDDEPEDEELEEGDPGDIGFIPPPPVRPPGGFSVDDD